MAVQYDIPYTFSGPDGTVAVVGPQDLANPNYVGLPDSITSVVEIRESIENNPESPGIAQGSNFEGRRLWTFAVLIDPGLGSNVNPRFDQLAQAVHAMRSDGTMTWTETGRAATRCLYRLQAWTPGDDKRPKRVFFSLSCAEPRILASSESSASPGSGLTNAGRFPTLPRFTFTSGASGTVVLSRTSPSPTESLTLTIGGTDGLAASTSTTVDFAARSVTQGSTNKRSAIQFPASVWWEMASGANTISVTGATGVTVFWRSAWIS